MGTVPPIVRTEPAVLGSTDVDPPAAATSKAHHRPGGGFDNPWETWKGLPGFSKAWKWNSERRKLKLPSSGWLETLGTHTQPSKAQWAAAFPAHARARCRRVWIGHASLLVQMHGVTFLTDPVLSERCSFSQSIGPKRVVPAALSVEHPDLPPIDFVIISHNHYDHLDHGTVMRLHQRFGKQLAWYVPLGLAAWFRSCGIKHATELDWWDEIRHPGSDLRLTFAPAQHWSARGLFDRRATLWGSWAVRGPELRFYFAGDTGYCPVFKEIGRRLGPFDLAAIPIGAYEPRWFMGPQHVDPAAAVRIHQEVGSRRSVGIHTATFCLTDEAMDEPPRLLASEAAAAGLAPDAFVTLQHGGLISTAGGRDSRRAQLLPASSAGA